jgi:glycosyltransferase involved in cell wall biosynthesis
MLMPKISIITVVYNGKKTLEETINSVLIQTYSNFEYILVDGGSTDGTLDILKKYDSKITKWISESDKGVYDAMNKAVRLCQGNWIYFLGADDVLCNKDVLQKVAAHLQKPKQIIYGNVIFKNESRIYDGPFNAFKIATRNISHQSIFYPKDVFQKYKFNIRYRVFADYHLNLLLFGNRDLWTFCYIPEIIAVFDDTGISGSGVVDAEFEKDRLSIIRANLPLYSYLYKVLRTRVASIFRK